MSKTNIISLGSCRINGPTEMMDKSAFNILNIGSRRNVNGLGVYNTKQIINIIDNTLRINKSCGEPLMNQFFVNSSININRCDVMICEISSLKVIMYKNKSMDINFGSVILKYLFNIHLDSHDTNIAINEFFVENVIWFVKSKSIHALSLTKNILIENLDKRTTRNIEDFIPILSAEEYTYLCDFVKCVNEMTFYEQTYEQLKEDIDYISSKIRCKIIFVPIPVPLKDTSGKLKQSRERLNNSVEDIIKKNPKTTYFNINNEIEINDSFFMEYHPVNNKYERERFGNIDYSHFSVRFNRTYSGILSKFIKNLIEPTHVMPEVSITAPVKSPPSD